MRGHEVIAALNERRSDKHCFVKWWRKEDDFLENTRGTEEIGGIDLMTMDDMWNEVRRVGGSRVTLLHDTDGSRVEWTHKGKSGVQKNTCAFTPETLIQIYDVETKGNAVDS